MIILFRNEISTPRYFSSIFNLIFFLRRKKLKKDGWQLCGTKTVRLSKIFSDFFTPIKSSDFWLILNPNASWLDGEGKCVLFALNGRDHMIWYSAYGQCYEFFYHFLLVNQIIKKKSLVLINFIKHLLTYKNFVKKSVIWLAQIEIATQKPTPK